LLASDAIVTDDDLDEPAGWRRMAVRSAVAVVIAVVVGVVVTVVLTAWSIASRTDAGVDRLVAQGQLLLGALGLVVTTVVAGATLYYAHLTRRLVAESHLSRVGQEEAWLRQREADAAVRLEGAIAALLGAATDVILVGSRLSVLLRSRRVFRVRAVDPLAEALGGVLRSAETVRYLAPWLADEVDGLMDAVSVYQSEATRRDGSPLEGLAERIADARTILVGAARQRGSVGRREVV
jgi:hypothetical protein